MNNDKDELDRDYLAFIIRDAQELIEPHFAHTLLTTDIFDELFDSGCDLVGLYGLFDKTVRQSLSNFRLSMPTGYLTLTELDGEWLDLNSSAESGQTIEYRVVYNHGMATSIGSLQLGFDGVRVDVGYHDRPSNSNDADTALRIRRAVLDRIARYSVSTVDSANALLSSVCDNNHGVVFKEPNEDKADNYLFPMGSFDVVIGLIRVFCDMKDIYGHFVMMKKEDPNVEQCVNTVYNELKAKYSTWLVELLNQRDSGSSHELMTEAVDLVKRINSLVAVYPGRVEEEDVTGLYNYAIDMYKDKLNDLYKVVSKEPPKYLLQ